MNSSQSRLPHHRLHAYSEAVALLAAVRKAEIRDRKLKDEATRAAKGCALNVAEGAGRYTKADKARSFVVARGEAVEAIAAVEIAAQCGECRAEVVPEVLAVGNRVYAMLTRLVR